MTAFNAIIPAAPSTAKASLEGVRAALPVIGEPHKATIESLNWLMGRGHPLAVHGPAWCPAWQERVFSFWVHPDRLHPNFTWHLSVSCVNNYQQPKAVTCTIATTVHIPSLDVALNTFTTSGDGTPISVVLREDVEPSNTPMEIHCTLSSDFVYPGAEQPLDEYYYLLVHGVHVMEAPQQRLNGYAGYTSSLDARQPIFWAGFFSHEISISAISLLATDVKDEFARRGALFNWYDGTFETASLIQTTNSADWTEIFPVRPAVQSRLVSQGQTLGTIRVNVIARVTGGTGHLRVTLSNGSTVTFDVTSTSIAWVGEQDMECWTDDPGRWETDGGLRGGLRDEVVFEMKAPAGETLYVRGLSISEAPTTGGEDESANVLVFDGTPITYGGEYIFVPVPYPP